MSKPAADRKDKGYLLHTWDGESMWGSTLHARGRDACESAGVFSTRIIEEMIDEEAAAHVDAIAYCLFTAFWSDLPSSEIADLFPWRPPGMDEEGIDLLKVLIERCRHHGMKFIADVRMNDRHGVPPNGIMKEHLEWALFGGAWDYAYDGVRQAMLDFTKEVLDGYEVDGIEYDYMRWCHMFKRGEGAKNAHLLTDFTLKTRELLDDAEKRRGCGRLLFGVRVPQIIEECETLGFDLATWIKEGLVDFVVPSDFMFTDTNMKTEDFVKLTEGTDCKVYPAIHNRFAANDPDEQCRLMNPANFRAAAQNFYAYGADGISSYNYQMSWGRRFHPARSREYASYLWPAALGWLRELRDPKEIAGQDRHYLFHALHRKSKTAGDYLNDENIYMDRATGVLEGSRRFRMTEDMSDPRLRATMQFKVLGLYAGEARDPDDRLYEYYRTYQDVFEIRINGNEVPAGYVTRVFFSRGQDIYEGNRLPCFLEYTIDLNWETTGRKQPLVFGDNELSVRVIPALGLTGEGARGLISVEELECYVYVRK